MMDGTPASTGVAAGLLSDYRAIEGAFDELMGPDGHARPEFRQCLDMLSALTPEAFARAQSLAELALLNQGVTFSV